MSLKRKSNPRHNIERRRRMMMERETGKALADEFEAATGSRSVADMVLKREVRLKDSPAEEIPF
jgi:hypothetical protein